MVPRGACNRAGAGKVKQIYARFSPRLAACRGAPSSRCSLRLGVPTVVPTRCANTSSWCRATTNGAPAPPSTHCYVCERVWVGLRGGGGVREASVERSIVWAGSATGAPPAPVSSATMITMLALPTLLALCGRLCRSRVRRGVDRHGAATAAPELLRRIMRKRRAPSENGAPNRVRRRGMPHGAAQAHSCQELSGRLAQPLPLHDARSCNERRRAAQCGARRRVAQRAAARRAAGSVTHTRACWPSSTAAPAAAHQMARPARLWERESLRSCE